MLSPNGRRRKAQHQMTNWQLCSRSYITQPKHILASQTENTRNTIWRAHMIGMECVLIRTQLVVLHHILKCMISFFQKQLTQKYRISLKRYGGEQYAKDVSTAFVSSSC